MKLKVKYDKKTDQHYFDLKDFKNIIDINKVEFYNLDTEGEDIALTFYDKKKKLMKPNLGKTTSLLYSPKLDLIAIFTYDPKSSKAVVDFENCQFVYTKTTKEYAFNKILKYGNYIKIGEL
jgi:uncharacterized protein YuzE